MKKAVIIDIDDCILNLTKRKSAIFSYLLKRKITVSEVIGKRTVDVLRKYLPEDKISEYRFKFWEIALCINEVGKKFIDLDEPVPFSRYIIKKLSKKYEIFYITNRIESMKDITTYTLKKFNFPYYENNIHADDYTFYKNENGRKSIISKLPKEYEYLLVVDDLPENFQFYKEINVNEIIGFMKYIILDKKLFYENGATLVIESWKDFPIHKYV